MKTRHVLTGLVFYFLGPFSFLFLAFVGVFMGFNGPFDDPLNNPLNSV